MYKGDTTTDFQFKESFFVYCLLFEIFILIWNTHLDFLILNFSLNLDIEIIFFIWNTLFILTLLMYIVCTIENHINLNLFFNC